MEWIHAGLPPYEDRYVFDVWLDDGSTRKVRRVGNECTVFSPGTLIFTDCVHPAQNALCHEPRVMSWRIH